MDIECKLKRAGGTKVTLDKTEYHFAPQADEAHVAHVANEAHADLLLAIPEGYRVYRGAHVASAGPTIEQQVERVLASAPAAAPVDEAPAAEVLIGSSVHPATFNIHGTTYQLGDIVARAHKGSGLDVQEWNELEDGTREDMIDEVLDALAADTNKSGIVSAAEDKAHLAKQYEAKFGKKPHHNLSAAKLREALKS